VAWLEAKESGGNVVDFVLTYLLSFVLLLAPNPRDATVLRRSYRAVQFKTPVGVWVQVSELVDRLCWPPLKNGRRDVFSCNIDLLYDGTT